MPNKNKRRREDVVDNTTNIVKVGGESDNAEELVALNIKVFIVN